MTSRRSTPPDPITLEAFGRALADRRAALGEPELPRNPGKRRTRNVVIGHGPKGGVKGGEIVAESVPERWRRSRRA